MNKQIWLITGISSGLGKAIANEVINRGDFAIGTFRNQQQVTEFNSQHEGKGKAYLLDLTSSSSIKNLVTSVINKFERIDVLVNNAGVGFAGAVEEADIEEIRKVLEVNFFGTVKLTQEILPFMRKLRRGNIIQISSHAGIKSFPGFGIYNASKFALEGISEAMAQELNPLGIKVQLVEPGPFRTNFAGISLMLASKEIEDYFETAGAFKKKLLSVHNKQEGDPARAAKIIYEEVKEGPKTLRLPLGKIPLTTIQMKIDSLQSDINSNREKAESAVYSELDTR